MCQCFFRDYACHFYTINKLSLRFTVDDDPAGGCRHGFGNRLCGRRLEENYRSINTVSTLPPPSEEIKINSYLKLYAVGVENT